MHRDTPHIARASGVVYICDLLSATMLDAMCWQELGDVLSGDSECMTKGSGEDVVKILPVQVLRFPVFGGRWWWGGDRGCGIWVFLIARGAGPTCSPDAFHGRGCISMLKRPVRNKRCT